MRPARLFCILWLLVVGSSLHAQDFSRAMRDIFGNQFRDYQWLDYPLDNFGVATSYRDTREVTNPKHFLCATFTCLAISPVPTADVQQWLPVAPSAGQDGYADFGCGGPVDAALNKKAKTAISAFLPKIVSLIGLSGDFHRDTSRNVEVTLSSACSRLLNGKINTYVKQLHEDPFGLKAALSAGELVLIKGDVVVKSFEVRVKKKSDLGVKLDATLQGAAAKKFGEGSKFQVELSRLSDGDFHLRTTTPVIVGVLPAIQPRTFGIASGPADIDLREWQATTVPIPPSAGFSAFPQ